MNSKAFTPVIVMLGLVLANIETPTFEVVMCVVAISIGTAVNCHGTMDYTTFGMLLMLGAEASGNSVPSSTQTNVLEDADENESASQQCLLKRSSWYHCVYADMCSMLIS